MLQSTSPASKGRLDGSGGPRAGRAVDFHLLDSCFYLTTSNKHNNVNKGASHKTDHWNVEMLNGGGESSNGNPREGAKDEGATPLTPVALDVGPLSFQLDTEEQPRAIEAQTDWLAKNDFKDAAGEHSSQFIRRAESESGVGPMKGGDEPMGPFSFDGSYIVGQAISETDPRQVRSRSAELFRTKAKWKSDAVSSANPDFSSDESLCTSMSLGTWNTSKGSPLADNAFFPTQGALKSDEVDARDNPAVSAVDDTRPIEEVTSSAKFPSCANIARVNALEEVTSSASIARENALEEASANVAGVNALEEASANVAREDAPMPIVRETDLQDISRYFYCVMAELQTCSFRPSDVIGKRRKLTTGYPGLECRHCRGAFSNQGRFFITQIKTFSDRTKSIDTFHRHLEWCRVCPQEVKDRLERSSYTHSSEIQELRAQGKKKTQKVFLDTIWGRLHSSEPTP